MLLKDLLKDARHQTGLSQVQMAEQLHLSFSAINRWENGHAKPSRIAAVALLDLLRDRGVPQNLISDLQKTLE